MVKYTCKQLDETRNYSNLEGVVIMMMYFEFNEDRLKKHNLTKEQCFSVIDKVMEFMLNRVELILLLKNLGLMLLVY